MQLKKILIILCFTSFVLGFTQPQSFTVTKPTPGNTYTVCSSGCDYTDLEAADGSVVAGDLLQIKAGTYNAVTWNSSAGTSGNEIVIEAFGDGDVFMETDSSYISNNFASDFIIVDGGSNREITFRKSTGDSSNGRTILRIVSNDVTIYRCKIVGSSGACAITDNALTAFGSPTTVEANSFKPDRPKLINCEIDGGPGSHKGTYVHGANDGVISGNEYHDIYGNTIQVNPRGGHEIDGLIIKNNVIYDGGPCATMEPSYILISGMTSGDGANPTIKNVEIYNNLFWDMDGTNAIEFNPAFDCPFAGDGEAAIKVYNNTVYNINKHASEAQYGIRINSSTTNDNGDDEIEIRNNIFYNIKSDPVIGQTGSGTVYIDSNNFKDTSDPSFQSQDDSNANFLKISASNDGDDTNPPVTDGYFGNTRSTTTPDIGAHEYEAPSTPTITVGAGTTRTMGAGTTITMRAN